MELFLLFSLYCSSLTAMNYLPENTILLSQEEAEKKVREYRQQGLSVMKGLEQDLRSSENHQTKETLGFLGLDVEQVFDEIQLAKARYAQSRVINPTAFWSKDIPGSLAENITNYATAMNIDPTQLIVVKKRDETKNKDFMGFASLSSQIEAQFDKSQLKILSIERDSFPKLRLTAKISKGLVPKALIPHELLHIQEKHGITHSIVGWIQSLASNQIKLSDVDHKKLKNNLILAQENFAEQYGILKVILKDAIYSKELFDLLMGHLSSAFIRYGEDHLSLYESYVAAKNITRLLKAEKRLILVENIVLKKSDKLIGF